MRTSHIAETRQTLTLISRIMEHTEVYRAWQAPFAENKFAPVLASNDLRLARRVLDVGCGPGTNAHYFTDANYTGVDCNPAYIEYARRHYQGNFVVANATTYRAESGQSFDFILVNSFLHHIDTPNARRILSYLSGLLAEDGHIHILELVLPERRSIAKLIAHLDRGDFPRPSQEWLELIEETLEPVMVKPYQLRAAGITLWNMVYLKCRAKS